MIYDGKKKDSNSDGKKKEKNSEDQIAFYLTYCNGECIMLKFCVKNNSLPELERNLLSKNCYMDKLNHPLMPTF
jgi:hypothetical protein